MSTLSCITEPHWSQWNLFLSVCFLCRGRRQEIYLTSAAQMLFSPLLLFKDIYIHLLILTPLYWRISRWPYFRGRDQFGTEIIMRKIKYNNSLVKPSSFMKCHALVFSGYRLPPGGTLIHYVYVGYCRFRVYVKQQQQKHVLTYFWLCCCSHFLQFNT